MSAIPITLRDVKHLSRSEFYGGVKRAMRKYRESSKRIGLALDVSVQVTNRLKAAGVICEGDSEDTNLILFRSLCDHGFELGADRSAVELVKAKLVPAEVAGRIRATIIKVGSNTN